MSQAQPVSVQAFPSRDPEFTDVLDSAVDEAQLSAATDDELQQLVEERLRRVYPNAVVKLQDPLARLAGSTPVMYAYRDGGIHADPAEGDVSDAGPDMPGQLQGSPG